MTVATATMGERGLLRLPAVVRAEVGVGKGDELVVTAVGPGRIVLTTRTAIQDEVWAAAPTGATDMRVEREADKRAVEAKERRIRDHMAATSEEESERIGTSLLTRFSV